MTTRQQTFAGASDEFDNYWKETSRRVHGGEYAKGKRKTARPFDTKKPVHLVLRASSAKGTLSLLSPRNQIPVKQIIHKFARRWGVTIYKYSNNGNHLHLALRAKNRWEFQKFLKTITGLIARYVLRAKKGKAKGKFWDNLAFTRVAEWGKAYKTLEDYVLQNILEAAGAIPYKPRRSG
jgi:REP element-mobilizing transposase RayT